MSAKEQMSSQEQLPAQNSGSQNAVEELKDQALAYLNENYNDTFLPVYFEGKNWAYSYDTISFTSEKYNGKSLYVYHNRTDTSVFVDNYFTLTMQYDAEEYFLKLLDMSDDDIFCRVNIDNPYRTDDLPANVTFLEYLSEGEIMLDIYFFSDNEIPKDLQEGFLSKMIEHKINAGVQFNVVRGNTVEMTQTSLDDILNNENMILITKQYLIKKDFSVVEY